jgi:hypothetical protein
MGSAQRAIAGATIRTRTIAKELAPGGARDFLAIEQQLFAARRWQLAALHVDDAERAIAVERHCDQPARFPVLQLENFMWYAYSIPPIDFKWERLKTVEETAAEIAAEEAVAKVKNGGDGGVEGPNTEEFLRAWESAKHEASRLNWEGDFRNDPVVFWVPVESEFEFGFVIKQDNNGSTFVISPVRLPHFDEYLEE